MPGTVTSVHVQAAMQTPDGAWRVEIVRRGTSRWYRLVNGDNELDWLTIAGVERLLGEAGVDISRLVDASPLPPEDETTHEGRDAQPA